MYKSKSKTKNDRKQSSYSKSKYKMINFGLMTEVPDSEDDTNHDIESYHVKINNDVRVFHKKNRIAIDKMREYLPDKYSQNIEFNHDLYSLGILMFYLCYGKKDVNFTETGKLKIPKSPKYNSSTRSIMRHCLEDNLYKLTTASEIKQLI